MSEPSKTMVLVCQNLDCKKGGSDKIIEDLQSALGDQETVEVRPYMCFGTCHEGPNVVIYPERNWYSQIQLEDIPDLIDSIKNGTKVERICDKVDAGAQDFIYNLLDAGIY